MVMDYSFHRELGHMNYIKELISLEEHFIQKVVPALKYKTNYFLNDSALKSCEESLSLILEEDYLKQEFFSYDKKKKLNTVEYKPFLPFIHLNKTKICLEIECSYSTFRTYSSSPKALKLTFLKPVHISKDCLSLSSPFVWISSYVSDLFGNEPLVSEEVTRAILMGQLSGVSVEPYKPKKFANTELALDLL